MVDNIIEKGIHAFDPITSRLRVLPFSVLKTLFSSIFSVLCASCINPHLTVIFTVPIDCRVSMWGSWSLPDPLGRSTRSRTIVRKPLNNGKQCPGLEQEKKGMKVLTNGYQI